MGGYLYLFFTFLFTGLMVDIGVTSPELQTRDRVLLFPSLSLQLPFEWRMRIYYTNRLAHSSYPPRLWTVTLFVQSISSSFAHGSIRPSQRGVGAIRIDSFPLPSTSKETYSPLAHATQSLWTHLNVLIAVSIFPRCRIEKTTCSFNR